MGARLSKWHCFQGRQEERTLSGLVSPCLTVSPDTLASSEPSPVGSRALLTVHPYYGQGKAAQALEKVPDHTQHDLAMAGTAAATLNPVPSVCSHTAQYHTHQPRWPRTRVTRSQW